MQVAFYSILIKSKRTYAKLNKIYQNSLAQSCKASWLFLHRVGSLLLCRLFSFQNKAHRLLATVFCTPGNALPANPVFGIGIYRVQDIAANGTADGYQHYSCWACAAQLVRGQSDTLRVNTITDEWQHLATSLKADSAGYVRITLVNESGTPAYFNNFTVGTVDPNHYQENHYDPWGLNLWASSAQSGYIGNENIRLL